MAGRAYDRGTVNAIRAALVVLWMRRLRYPWSRLRRALFERGNRALALPAAGSLADVAGALDEVEWTLDGPLHLWDAISYPQTTWRTKRDDCDGFAVLAAELLHRLDAAHEPLLLTAIVLPLRRAHTVCVFSEPGQDGLRVFDNERLLADRFPSRAAVAEWVAQRGETAVCWDVVTHDTLRVVEFHSFP